MFLHFHSIPLFNTMQCQDILHFRNPSSCSSHIRELFTLQLLYYNHIADVISSSALDIVHLLLLRREQGAVVQCRSGDMTTLGLDGDVPSACCGRSSSEDPRGQLIFLLQAMGKSHQDQGSRFASKGKLSILDQLGFICHV